MRLAKKPTGRLFAVATEATVPQISFLEYPCCSGPGVFIPEFSLGSCATSSGGDGRSDLTEDQGHSAFSVVGGTASAVAGAVSDSELFAEGYSRDTVVV